MSIVTASLGIEKPGADVGLDRRVGDEWHHLETRYSVR